MTDPRQTAPVTKTPVHRIGRDYTHGVRGCGAVMTMMDGDNLLNRLWCQRCGNFVPVGECRWLNGSPIK